MGRYDWERLVRRLRVAPNVKFTAQTLASYGDRDGTRIRPGNKRLAAVTGYEERTIVRALTQLRILGLIEVSRRGGGRHGKGRATEYRLTIPSDLVDRVPLLDPDEQACL